MHKKLQKILHLTLLLVYCSFRAGYSGDRVDTSFSPPGGLTVENTPQFVIMGFDDNTYIDGMEWVLDLLDGKTNPPGRGNSATFDGQPIKASFYFIANAVIPDPGDPNDVAYKAQLLGLWQQAVAAGYEVGNHTYTHQTTSALSKAQWLEEINTCTDALVDLLGINASDIWGFRTPYLDYGRTTFDAISEAGLVYECTVTHQADYNKKQHVWPYTLHNGFNRLSNSPASSDWTFPGIWEIPVYTTSIDITGHPPVCGFDSSILTQAYGDKFDVMLKTGLDYRLTDIGNRAPYTIGLHSDTYSDENLDAQILYDPQMTLPERKLALSGFIDYALTIPEVRFITAKQFIQWMRNPAGLDAPTDTENSTVANVLSPCTIVSLPDAIYVTLPSHGSFHIAIYSASGKSVFSKNSVNREHILINASAFSRGMWFIKINGKNFTQVEQLVIQ